MSGLRQRSLSILKHRKTIGDTDSGLVRDDQGASESRSVSPMFYATGTAMGFLLIQTQQIRV